MGFKAEEGKITRNIVVETQDQCISRTGRKVCDVDHTVLEFQEKLHAQSHGKLTLTLSF